MRRERPKTYKKWKCPRCGSRFDNPIGLTAAMCPKQYHGTRKDPVPMKPWEEVSA